MSKIHPRRPAWVWPANSYRQRRDGWSEAPHQTIHLAAGHLQGSRGRSPSRAAFGGRRAGAEARGSSMSTN